MYSKREKRISNDKTRNVLLLWKMVRTMLQTLLTAQSQSCLGLSVFPKKQARKLLLSSFVGNCTYFSLKPANDTFNPSNIPNRHNSRFASFPKKAIKKQPHLFFCGKIAHTLVSILRTTLSTLLAIPNESNVWMHQHKENLHLFSLRWRFHS